MKLLCALIVTLAASSTYAADLTPQDYLQIEQLYAAYNHAIDSGDAEGWANTFTPDGVFSNRFTGRDALMGFVKSWQERGGASRRHWNSNLRVVATAEGASGSVYLMLWDVGQKPATIVSTGKYEDVLVNTATGWRFKSRVVKGDAAPTATGQQAAPAAPSNTQVK
jgi:hypothetical protein